MTTTVESTAVISTQSMRDILALFQQKGASAKKSSKVRALLAQIDTNSEQFRSLSASEENALKGHLGK